jgi:DNA primase
MNEKITILKSFLGEYIIDGKEYLFSCPKCAHHKNKLSINPTKSVWKCWICGYSGRKLRKMVKEFGTRTHLTRWDAIDDDTGTIRDIKELLSKTETVAPIPMTLPPEYVFMFNAPKTDREYKKAYKYIKSRNISDEDILKWKIGFCPSGIYGGRIIIPSFDMNGDVNFFIGRSYCGSNFTYKNPKTDKTKIVFNELNINWDKPIVLVEGVFDALKSVNAIPLLGSSLKKTNKVFQKIVLADVPIYLALDFDADDKAEKIIDMLIKYDVDVFKINSFQERDIGDSTKKEFETMFKDAIKYDASISLKNKIMAV